MKKTYVLTSAGNDENIQSSPQHHARTHRHCTLPLCYKREVFLDVVGFQKSGDTESELMKPRQLAYSRRKFLDRHVHYGLVANFAEALASAEAQ